MANLRDLAHHANPVPGLGMTSMVLGIIAMLLAFLPVLGFPLAVFGLVFGFAGIVAVFFSRSTSLRWSVGGALVSALALGVNTAIGYAPSGYEPSRQVPPMWQTVPYRPQVSPPAPPQ
jgi:hypothetical protein